MFPQYTEDGNTVMVHTTYAEVEAYRAAGVTFPPKAVGFRWDPSHKVWALAVRDAGPERINRLFNLIQSGADAGLPGLTPELVQPKEARQPRAAEPVQDRKADLPAAATYTVVWGGGAEYTTIRLETPWDGLQVPEGTLVASYLYGPDNTTDFQGFGFVTPSGDLKPWRKYADPEVLDTQKAAVNVLLHADAEGQAAGREAYALRSGRCARCGRTLTVPASLHRGVGPDCAGKLGG